MTPQRRRIVCLNRISLQENCYCFGVKDNVIIFIKANSINVYVKKIKNKNKKVNVEVQFQLSI